MPSSLIKWFDERFYPDFEDRWDNFLFRKMIAPYIDNSSTVLDLGAGRGANPDMNFRGVASEVHGVDPDPVVAENPYLDEARLLQPPGYLIPYEMNKFDVIFSNNVIEHVVDIEAYLSEVLRVLKPGGHFFAKTPNRWHYVAGIAQLTPHWFHDFYNRLRGRESHDTFPTTYVCNSRSQATRSAKKVGLSLEEFKIIEGRPEYLRLNALFYAVGLGYEKVVNSLPLEAIRCVILMKMRKPAATEEVT